MSELTPYDTGERLEPQVWARPRLGESTIDPDTEPANFGKVDFDNDESATVTTAYIERNPAGDGFILHLIDPLGPFVIMADDKWIGTVNEDGTVTK